MKTFKERAERIVSRLSAEQAEIVFEAIKDRYGYGGMPGEAEARYLARINAKKTQPSVVRDVRGSQRLADVGGDYVPDRDLSGELSLVLTGPGERKMAVIALVRKTFPAMTITEAKDFVETRSVVYDHVYYTRVTEFARLLDETGADFQIIDSEFVIDQ